MMANVISTTIPYTVIGGYLGAGKTTLLNNLLRNSQGLRLAVLVNDFGDINIDADLITSHDGETINLASGCICCSLADGFMLALNRVSKRRGEIDGVEQLTRYLELLNRDPLLSPVRGIFAAQEIKPQARVLATDRGIACAVVDYDALRGLDDPSHRLF